MGFTFSFTVYRVPVHSPAVQSAFTVKSDTGEDLFCTVSQNCPPEKKREREEIAAYGGDPDAMTEKIVIGGHGGFSAYGYALAEQEAANAENGGFLVTDSVFPEDRGCLYIRKRQRAAG